MFLEKRTEAWASERVTGMFSVSTAEVPAGSRARTIKV
ncbi:MAG: hypothetical protein BWY88_00839 [Synergistetes bacterium ADurb.Bin520]|nr:MAG: hypothetical protein BWY88_00839 [Synergistetes bacterium ADurb.Bin520]